MRGSFHWLPGKKPHLQQLPPSAALVLDMQVEGLHQVCERHAGSMCRVSGALGWAASLDILLLFYPVPRSCFLNRLLGAGFPLLIKYHRWLGHGTMWLLSLHGCGYYALWCVLLLLGARRLS